MSYTEPTVLHSVLFDVKRRIFYCEERPQSPFEIFGEPLRFQTEKPSIDSESILLINEPTYMKTQYHSCFGHAYIDETFPILSILHDYDSSIMDKREFRIFILKDTFIDYTSDSAIKSMLNDWEVKYVDYDGAAYREPYRSFHQAKSVLPPLFEKTVTYDYIQFKTLLYGGNTDGQRTIHNSAARYPGRSPARPLVSDSQIRAWIQLAKQRFAKSMGITLEYAERPHTTLLIARRGPRQFTGRLLSFLQMYFDTEAVYLEEYSLEEQIRLFQSASKIVAAHGSSLYHCVWAAPGTQLIELFAGKDPRNPIFESYATFLGLNYTRVELSERVVIQEESLDVPDDLPPKALFPEL